MLDVKLKSKKNIELRNIQICFLFFLSFRPRVKHGVTLLDAESKVWIPVFTGMTRKIK